MATEAQIAANRANAQASTGPRTAEGKARSARNATSLGLFTKHNCVQPEEQEEYTILYDALWLDLRAVGAMEQMFATEIIRGAWRLRHCAIVEATLAISVGNANRQEHERRNGKDAPYPGTCDPLFYDYSRPGQVAVDRARTQANGAMRRAVAELRRLQTERLLRTAILGENADVSALGLASLGEVLPKLEDQGKAELISAYAGPSPVAKPEITNRTESTPRGALCPCGSGNKYKRCCGIDAPAILTRAA
jgi:hypothetical protein